MAIEATIEQEWIPYVISFTKKMAVEAGKKGPVFLLSLGVPQNS